MNITNNGAVNVNAGGSLNGVSPTVTVSNSGGTGFTVASGGTLSSTLNLVNNGTTTFNSSQAIATLNGTNTGATLSQSGTLTVSGGGTYQGTINNGASTGSVTVSSGTLILTGANQYTGATTINGGSTLQIDDGTLNSGSLNSNTAITDNGTLTFLRTDGQTISNNISGTGAVQIGSSIGNIASSINLSGNNSYGATNILSGSLNQMSATALGVAHGWFSSGHSGERVQGSNK